MRSMSLLIAGGLLASCSMGPPTPPIPPTAEGMHQYDLLLAGKVAQRPVSCLPTYSSNDMVRLDPQTLGFRVGGGTSYVVHLGPGCEALMNPTATLVSHQPGGSGLCTHDIERVIDTSGFPIGSCSIEEVVPYVRR